MNLLRSIIITMLATLTIACSSEQGKTETIKVAYVDWETEVASTSMIKVLLEEAGYQVKLLPMQVAEMWEAVASGKADGMVSAWLPKMHEEYLNQYRERIENLGYNLEGTRVGLVVPAYVNMLNIYELTTYATELNNRIFGIEASSGIMKKTEEAMKVYKLEFFLIDSTEKKMIDNLREAIAAKKWIVITGWSPNWIFDQWSLKFLDDPEDVYGKKGTINTIVRKNLQKDAPKAYQIFKNFYWEPDEMASLMLLNHQSPGDPEKNAKAWLAKHPTLHARWLWKIKYSWLHRWYL